MCPDAHTGRSPAPYRPRPKGYDDMDRRADTPNTRDDHIENLKAHVPYLRRYALALTGDLDLGDGFVTRVLDDAMKAPDVIRLENPRLALYAALNELADAMGLRPAPSPHPVEAALASLPEDARRLYLLVSLEDLPLTDAAAVLGMAAEEAVERLNEARRRVRERLTATILIVEDDAIIAFDLAETVRGMGHIVCGTAPTMDEAVSLAAAHAPTLALLDIRLAEGGNGIEVARELRRRRFLPVIFVTAFPDELARRGLEHLGPVIPKPFTRDQIEQAITRAVFTPADTGGPTAVSPAA